MEEEKMSVFPEFRWDEFYWVTYALLSDWVGFQIRNGAYGAVSDDGVSDGLIKIVFAPEGRGDEPLSQREINLVKWVIENQVAMHNAMLKYLFNEYPRIREQYLECMCPGDELTRQSLPEFSTPEQLKKSIGIISLNVHPLEKSGKPFVGIELGCEWDEEHGLGMLFHGIKPLEIGQADTAILLWIAKKYCQSS